MANQTKVDDLLIKMIAPKIQEIESRFSSGEGLNSEDVNTLLLKSQYNHINHLDEKLNEVTADVASLKLDFAHLKSDFAQLRSDFAALKSDVKIEISGMKTEISQIRTEIASMKADIQQTINKNMQWSIGLIAFLVTALKLADTIWHH